MRDNSSYKKHKPDEIYSFSNIASLNKMRNNARDDVSMPSFNSVLSSQFNKNLIQQIKIFSDDVSMHSQPIVPSNNQYTTKNYNKTSLEDIRSEISQKRLLNKSLFDEFTKNSRERSGADESRKIDYLEKRRILAQYEKDKMKKSTELEIIGGDQWIEEDEKKDLSFVTKRRKVVPAFQGDLMFSKNSNITILPTPKTEKRTIENNSFFVTSNKKEEIIPSHFSNNLGKEATIGGNNFSLSNCLTDKKEKNVVKEIGDQKFIEMNKEENFVKKVENKIEEKFEKKAEEKVEKKADEKSDISNSSTMTNKPFLSLNTSDIKTKLFDFPKPSNKDTNTTINITQNPLLMPQTTTGNLLLPKTTQNENKLFPVESNKIITNPITMFSNVSDKELSSQLVKDLPKQKPLFSSILPDQNKKIGLPTQSENIIVLKTVNEEKSEINSSAPPTEQKIETTQKEEKSIPEEKKSIFSGNEKTANIFNTSSLYNNKPISKDVIAFPGDNVLSQGNPFSSLKSDTSKIELPNFTNKSLVQGQSGVITSNLTGLFGQKKDSEIKTLDSKSTTALNQPENPLKFLNKTLGTNDPTISNIPSTTNGSSMTTNPAGSQINLVKRDEKPTSLFNPDNPFVNPQSTSIPRIFPSPLKSNEVVLETKITSTPSNISLHVGNKGQGDIFSSIAGKTNEFSQQPLSHNSFIPNNQSMMSTVNVNPFYPPAINQKMLNNNYNNTSSDEMAISPIASPKPFIKPDFPTNNNMMVNSGLSNKGLFSSNNTNTAFNMNNTTGQGFGNMSSNPNLFNNVGANFTKTTGSTTGSATGGIFGNSTMNPKPFTGNKVFSMGKK